MGWGSIIQCNGMPGTGSSEGGGSGGSVWISVRGSIEGHGNIRANGGAGGAGGGGGGGRVAVHYGQELSTSIFSYAVPGSGVGTAGSGSIVTCDSVLQYFDASVTNCVSCPSSTNAGGPSSWSGWLKCCGAGLYLADAQSTSCTK